MSCKTQPINVIPYPNHVEQRSGTFNTGNLECIVAKVSDSKVLKNIESFAEDLGVEVLTDHGADSDFVFEMDSSIADESYYINVNRQSVIVKAGGLRGFVYAISTLKQMLPEIPCCTIEDSPRFGYRGLHLDEARHFFGKEQVIRCIDIMAYHKLNTLHWHLTDDQGWRIQILKYPELTEVGSVRNGTCIKRNYNTNDGIPYGEGMWYTQDDIREIVDYAASKGIEIIPEIDLPGHMLAALAAYPHLGCAGGPYQVWHRWGVSQDVLCVGNEEVYVFLEDVLSEVCELFPSSYIHIGGDECPKDSWKTCPECQAKIKELGIVADGEHTAEHFLQSYVMNRVEEFLQTKGKRVIGWDEILEGAPSQSATVMSWRGEAGGIKASSMGHDVIMTPNTYCYWDYYQATDIENEPFAIGGYVPVELVYSYEPFTESMDQQARDHILGVQANLWTEYIIDGQHLEYMFLPRLAALSEVQWCTPENKDWKRFLDSIDELCAEYKKMGYNYAEHIFGAQADIEAGDGFATVTLSAQGDAPVRYTLDGSDPTTSSAIYETPLKIQSTCVLKASAERNGVMTRPCRQSFCFHKAVGRPLTLTHPSEADFASEEGYELLDGIRGPAIHKSKEWCSWLAKPLEMVIDMEGTEPYSRVEVGYFANKPSQIFNPISLEVSVSENGVEFIEVASEHYQAEGEFEPDGLKSVSVQFDPTTARYVRIKAECLEGVPQWHHYYGRKASIYVDEVIVE